MTRVVFLDRDGVINRYPGDGKYVTHLKEFRFLPKVKKAIALLTARKYPIFIISNQAGVGKGLYTREDLDRITGYMLKELARNNANVRAVYYCTHRNEDNCSCRKPKAGLIKKALKDFNLSSSAPAFAGVTGRSRRKVDIRNSFFVGDTIRDIQTARAAGCRSILVFSGQEKPANRDGWQIQPDYVFPNLYQAVRFIIGRNKG